MAETLTSHEIEDVLSSIRRLVSEEMRPVPRPAEAVAAGSRLTLRPAAAVSEKLILTAALRVEDQPEPPHVAAASAAEVVVPPEAEPGMDVDRIEDAVWAAAGGDEAAYIEDIDPATVPPAPERGHWTADTMPEVAWMQPDEDWAPQEPVPFVAHRRRGGEAPESEATVFGTAAVVADHEELVVEAATAAVTEDLSAAAMRTVRASEPGVFAADPGLIDEALLRDRVRQIIREELAGTLGERITRNVRKLVRIEVNRALTAREFE